MHYDLSFVDLFCQAHSLKNKSLHFTLKVSILRLSQDLSILLLSTHIWFSRISSLVFDSIFDIRGNSFFPVPFSISIVYPLMLTTFASMLLCISAFWRLKMSIWWPSRSVLTQSLLWKSPRHRFHAPIFSLFVIVNGFFGVLIQFKASPKTVSLTMNEILNLSELTIKDKIWGKISSG